MKPHQKTRSIALALLAAALVAGGCNSVRYSPAQEAKYVKPTIAVMSFENRAPVHTKWHLGDALADQLIDRLIRTRRYVVLERAQLQAIFNELSRGKDKRFRKDSAPQLGQLKHVRYLIKGTITDFGHVESVPGIWQVLKLISTTSNAIVSATIYVVDVQSGQVIASQSVEATVPESKHNEKVELGDAAFGSYTFYHTSVGRATNKMLDKAVRAIARAITDQPFQPKISSIVNNQVIINGGRNRRLKVDSEYIIRPTAEAVLDPDSGDILGHITGEVLGRVRIMQVLEKYAIAEVVTGTGFAPGQTLFPYEPEQLAAPAAKSSY